jgi:hypothetical protein
MKWGERGENILRTSACSPDGFNWGGRGFCLVFLVFLFAGVIIYSLSVAWTHVKIIIAQFSHILFSLNSSKHFVL